MTIRDRVILPRPQQRVNRYWGDVVPFVLLEVSPLAIGMAADQIGIADYMLLADGLRAENDAHHWMPVQEDEIFIRGAGADGAALCGG